MLVNILVTAITAASVVGCSIENGQESMVVPGSVELERGVRVDAKGDLIALRDETLAFMPVAQGERHEE